MNIAHHFENAERPPVSVQSGTLTFLPFYSLTILERIRVFYTSDCECTVAYDFCDACNMSVIIGYSDSVPHIRGC